MDKKFEDYVEPISSPNFDQNFNSKTQYYQDKQPIVPFTQQYGLPSTELQHLQRNTPQKLSIGEKILKNSVVFNGKHPDFLKNRNKQKKK